MSEVHQGKVVLLAEDDEDHLLLARDAFKDAEVRADLRWVRNGEELMEYLLGVGSYSAPGSAPRPKLILLDLNMPKKDGREALKEIKSYPQLKTIPIVVLTTSLNEEDIHYTYSLGGSFIRKPVRYEQIVEMVRVVAEYWLELVE